MAGWSLKNHSEPSGFILVNSMPMSSKISPKVLSDIGTKKAATSRGILFGT